MSRRQTQPPKIIVSPERKKDLAALTDDDTKISINKIKKSKSSTCRPTTRVTALKGNLQKHNKKGKPDEIRTGEQHRRQLENHIKAQLHMFHYENTNRPTPQPLNSVTPPQIALIHQAIEHIRRKINTHFGKKQQKGFAQIDYPKKKNFNYKTPGCYQSGTQGHHTTCIGV